MLPDTRYCLPDAPGVYRIRIQGRLDTNRLRYLLRTDAFKSCVRGRPPTTTITGPVVDQASLLSVLTELYDLGYTFLDIRRLPERADAEPPAYRSA